MQSGRQDEGGHGGIRDPADFRGGMLAARDTDELGRRREGGWMKGVDVGEGKGEAGVVAC
jgi:hypothetical protein